MKPKELHRKICKAVVDGKLQFTEHIDLRMATKNLEMAVEIEEYEAAQIFKEHIEKLKILKQNLILQRYI